MQRRLYEEQIRQQQLQQQQQQAYMMQQQRMMQPPMPPPVYGQPQGPGVINVTIKDHSQTQAPAPSVTRIVQKGGPPSGESVKEIRCKKCKQITNYYNSRAQTDRIRCKGCSAVLIKHGHFRQ
jgi:ribosomal protein S27E